MLGLRDVLIGLAFGGFLGFAGWLHYYRVVKRLSTGWRFATLARILLGALGVTLLLCAVSLAILIAFVGHAAAQQAVMARVLHLAVVFVVTWHSLAGIFAVCVAYRLAGQKAKGEKRGHH